MEFGQNLEVWSLSSLPCHLGKVISSLILCTTFLKVNCSLQLIGDLLGYFSSCKVWWWCGPGLVVVWPRFGGAVAQVWWCCDRYPLLPLACAKVLRAAL